MVEVSGNNLMEAAKMLGGIKNGMERVAARAINHTTAKAKNHIKKQVTKGYHIKNQDVEKTLDIKKATWNNPFASITSRSPVLPLGKFKIAASGTELKVAVSKLEGYTVRKKAFISSVKDFGKNPSGMKSIRIFKRKGKARLPIQLQYGASVPGMIGNQNITKELDEFISKNLEVRLSREVEYMLGRYKR
ncbi:phage tail protein [Cetobacterium sp. ZOR0034]|uniref:phage tail protein n=1 Tax=Cetobacterium sp. ZOR0034 TaxID=1339239 RepID=UPI000647E51F|nr:phage tail protein [Cetobacterium sp. ZOR0034]